MTMTEKVLKTVKRTILENNMFEPDDRVIVAVSGGADSIVLLHILNTLKREFGFKLEVAHVNHMIRVGEAERDASFVKKVCEIWNIPYNLKIANVRGLAEETGRSEEEVGRQVRYDFFNELAGSWGKIATAHNANDNVETILMRMMRGTSITGLAGIPFKRKNIVRPLLNVTREEIEGYAEESGLEFVTDSTNCVSVYTRNKIRLDLIPYIKDTFNPNLIATIQQNIQSYREDAEYLENEANRIFNLISSDKGDKLSLDLDSLKDVYPTMGKRVLLKAIKRVMHTEQPDISAYRLTEIYNNLDKKVGTTFYLSTDYRIRIDYNRVLIVEKKTPKKFLKMKKEFLTGYILTIKDSSEETVFSYGDDLTLKCRSVYMENIENTSNKIYLPLSMYHDLNFVLRTRRDGDIFRVDSNSHKKLNRMFTDKKISNIEQRDNVICLCNGNEVLWAIGCFATRFEKRSGKFLEITAIF